MTAQDEFGVRIPGRIVNQTFDIAPPACEQLIPQERLPSTNRGAESGNPDASDRGAPTGVGQR